MKLRKSLCILLITLSSTEIFTVTALADEGMWTFNNVPKAENQTPVWLRYNRCLAQKSAVGFGAIQRWCFRFFCLAGLVLWHDESPRRC